MIYAVAWVDGASDDPVFIQPPNKPSKDLVLTLHLSVIGDVWRVSVVSMTGEEECIVESSIQWNSMTIGGLRAEIERKLGSSYRYELDEYNDRKGRGDIWISKGAKGGKHMDGKGSEAFSKGAKGGKHMDGMDSEAFCKGKYMDGKDSEKGTKGGKHIEGKDSEAFSKGKYMGGKRGKGGKCSKREPFNVVLAFVDGKLLTADDDHKQVATLFKGMDAIPVPAGADGKSDASAASNRSAADCIAELERENN